MTRFVVTTIFLVCVLGIGAVFAEELAETRLSEGYEESLGGWNTVGDVEVSLGDDQPHSGTKCAHLRVLPNAPLTYQRIERTFAPVAWGDRFRVSVWVRTDGVSDGNGAYVALDFLDGAGVRTDVAHGNSNARNGTEGWRELIVEGMAPKGTEQASVDFVLNAHGDAWFDDATVVQTERREPMPDLGDAERVVTVDSQRVILSRFGGVGFHVFDHTFPAPEEYMNTVLGKRWRELNPSFARINHFNSWDAAKLDDVAAHLLRMKNDTNTEIYVTTWDPKIAPPGDERMEYARHVAGILNHWVKEQGAANITTYCVSNELSLGEWGKMHKDLPTFKDYHACLFKAFQEKDLNIRLLATDASPFSYWDSIQWAADNMDDITGIYGGHHYVSEYEPEDPYFYPWFLKKVSDGVAIARSKGKDFILGEFGSKQDGRVIDGIRRDVCVYWDTPREPIVPIQLAEAIIAALNAGVYAMGYWTFGDLPDDFAPGYLNKWGLYKRSGNDNSTRANYYAYGLLTRFFRGPAEVLSVAANDPRVRAAAIRHQGAQTISIAVVNRCAAEVPVRIDLGPEAPGRAFRKYVYDPLAIPFNAFGDMQPPAETIQLRNGALSTRVGANTLSVFTSAYDDEPPSPVQGVSKADTAAGVELKWQPNTEQDLCYYRVYRSHDQEVPANIENQIGSTIATKFAAPASPGETWHYAIVAVDKSGNPGPAGTD